MTVTLETKVYAALGVLLIILFATTTMWIAAVLALAFVVVSVVIIRKDIRARKQLFDELDRFFNLSLDMCCIVGFDGYFKRLNPRWTTVLGFTQEDLMAKPHREFIHPDDLERTIQEEKALVSGKTMMLFENRYRCKDGSYRWLIWNAVLFRENKVIYAAARDITERKNARLEVENATRKLAAAVDEGKKQADELHCLSEVTDLLQICESPDEAYKVISRTAQAVFPSTSGAIYRFSASRNLLETVSVWGEERPQLDVFGPDVCLALRRGRPQVFDKGSPLQCEHVSNEPKMYVCIPMLALGDTLGVLHLRQDECGDKVLREKLRMAMTLAEQAAMTLANLRLRESLRLQSIRDALTGLFNRRYLEESLEREVRRAIRKHSQISAIMLDLDHFKRFNDTHGHDAGDAVLRELGMFIQVRVRAEDIACRLGGEEFAIILPDTPLEQASQIAERICCDVRSMLVRYQDQSLGSVTISLGVASFPDHADSGETLLIAADRALYKAKACGRNQVVFAGR